MTEKFETKLDFARFLAVEAGTLARELYKNKDKDFVSVKGLQDFVTIADRKVEQRIRALIKEYYPSDAVLGEEEGQSGQSEAIWVVDPIDGTANYMRGLPDWAVSIAYCENEEIMLGAIYAPDRDELCWAAKDQGAFCNGFAIEVSNCSQPDQAVLLLGRSSRKPLQEYLDIVQHTVDANMEYRRNGSAAVSLMWVAQGRAEGYYEAHLNAWDALAGVLIIREAGGLVRSQPVAETLKNGSEILAIVPELERITVDTIMHQDFVA
ncbi:inositol monophosphatase family protein [Roseibium sp. RKSG952]|uniref:inositol monophosphatase family protein n=1 Tax=Roseibium sp. RKSG952 TaxID=2529384 RepID=UPI0012BBC1CF|nr:inositol monophosphatase family protein [Roseibium sp. RKSG952]MTI01956.1 inositol monophosphatase [Roseibium sp. RKSG952]